MELKSLRIDRLREWQSKDCELRGVVEFNGQYGEVKLNLDEDLSRKIVAICAEEIVQASRQVAEHMTAETIQSVAALPPAAE